jgi:hypothetical protein
MPNPWSRHKRISYVKSLLRILGYVALILALPQGHTAVAAGWFLVISEIIGIVEEFDQ